jgi:pyruvate formate lyase activating enzyme
MSTVKKQQCVLCPRHCKILPDTSGDCLVRVNDGGKLRLTTYGRPCSVQVDPIEKKPLFHFLPGSPILSIGTAGCNLHCGNCQNWKISQAAASELPAYDLPPEKVVALALRHGAPAVAYTYTEPLVSYEYVRDCAKACRKAGLRNVLVTAAYFNVAPLKALLPHIDGVNADIKAMSDNFYRVVCDAWLVPVLKAIETIHDAGVLLEITNLVIPTLNDSDEKLQKLAQWVAQNLGAETPLHFSRFFPVPGMSYLPPTPPETLLRAYEIASAEGLKHVYLGNIDLKDSENTMCAGCGTVLIKRHRYDIAQNRIVNGKCPECDTKLYGIFS